MCKGSDLQRRYCFVNLVRKYNESATKVECEFQDLCNSPTKQLPEDWSAICDHIKRVTFIRSEQFEFNGQRIFTERT